MKYTFKAIRPNVFLVEADSQYAICSMFMRPQEFYESPFDEIRGKYFSVEQYMDVYARENGAFTYLTDWCGFNIPGHIFVRFADLFSYDFTKKETYLVNEILRMETIGERFYVIGACKQKMNKVTIAHEIAHAYYYMYEDYRNAVDKLLTTIEIPEELFELAKHSLLKRGYDESVVLDEMQAYLATASRKDLLNCFNWPKETRIPRKIRKFYNSFDEAHK